jgi:hypothetical protein
VDSDGKNFTRSSDNGISEVFGPSTDSEGHNGGSNCPIPWYGGKPELELRDVSRCGEMS